MKPSEREIEVAKILGKAYGGQANIIPRINNPAGIKTPDYIINNEKFDLSKICPFPFLRLFNSRHDFTLKNGENIITLSFDIITYNEAIQELMVEIETKKTTNPKVLEDINELIKRKYDLKTTKQSKYQRGIELTKLALLTRKHL